MTGVSSTPEGAKITKEELGEKFKMKDLGDANLILGIHINCNREAGMIKLSQCAYLEHMLERYRMSDCST